jgi:hypothetical protein
VTDSFLREAGTYVMRARQESPRDSYATLHWQMGMTRAPRRRQLPTNHGHAALSFGTTRAYQPDSSSKPPHHPLRVGALRNFDLKRGSGPPKKSLDGWSFHISCGTEFGYDDFGVTPQDVTHRRAELRRDWFQRGAVWFDPHTPRPVGWDPLEQAANAGLGFSLSSATTSTGLPRQKLGQQSGDLEVISPSGTILRELAVA